MSKAKERDHERFLKNLDESEGCVWLAAKYLKDKGFSVTVKANTKSKSYGDRLRHTDHGDLAIQKEEKKIEVKHIYLPFTSADDFPHPRIMVCAKHRWDFANPKPDYFMLFNEDMTHFAKIFGHTHETWDEFPFNDRRYEDMKQVAYRCPLDLVEWIKL